MNKYIIILALLLPGCEVYSTVTYPAEVVDVGINCAIGGKCGNTISGDTGIARAEGSKTAGAWCGMYSYVLGPILYPYDQGHYDQASWDIFREYLGHEGQQPNDHCGRWYLNESGKLAEIKKERGL